MAIKNMKVFSQYDFSGGINVSAVSSEIENNELDFDYFEFDGTKNCYWDNGIRRRNGLAKINTTAYTQSLLGGIRYYYEGDTKFTVFAVFNGTDVDLYAYDDNSFTLITTFSDITQEVDLFFVQWKYAIYIATGITALKKVSYDGSSWTVTEITDLKDGSGTTYHPQFVYQFKDRLWVAGGNMPESYFECSAYDDDSVWTYGSNATGEGFNAGYQEGDKIMQISSVKDKLVILKYDSIWVLEGDNLVNWFQRKNQKSIGCIASKSVVALQDFIIFASIDGVYVFDGEKVLKISKKIDKILEQAYDRTLFISAYDGKHYRLAINREVDGDGINRYELLFNIDLFKQGKLSWWFYDNRTIRGYITYNGEGDNDELVILDNNGYLVKEYGTKDYDDDIEMRILSKAYDFGFKNIRKRYDTLKVAVSGYAGLYTFYVWRNVNKELNRQYTYDTSENQLVWGSGNWGETTWSVIGFSKFLREIRLPSIFDGNELVLDIRNNDGFEDVIFLGFDISFNVDRF